MFDKPPGFEIRVVYRSQGFLRINQWEFQVFQRFENNILLTESKYVEKCLMNSRFLILVNRAKDVRMIFC